MNRSPPFAAARVYRRMSCVFCLFVAFSFSLFLSAARSPVGLTSFSPSTLSLASFCHFFFQDFMSKRIRRVFKARTDSFRVFAFFLCFFFFSFFFWRKWKLRLHAECKKLRTYKILRDPESQLSIILRQASSFSGQLSSILVKPNLIRSFDTERSFRKPHLVTADIFGVLFFTRHPRGRFFPPTSGIFKNPLKREREREERKSDELDDRWLFTISRDGRMIPVIREHQSVNGLSIVLEKPKGRGDRALVSVAGSYETNICALDGNAYAECRMRKNA